MNNNIQKNEDHTEVLICACNSSEHQLVIHFLDYNGEIPNYKEVVISPHLVTYRNIFKRIRVAIKYIFGYKSKYGHWDSIIINDQNYSILKEAINFLEK